MLNSRLSLTVIVSFFFLSAGIFTCVVSASPQCTSGFISKDEIETRDQNDVTLPNFDSDVTFTQWIFPSIKFTCDAIVTGWILQGEIINKSVDNIFDRGSPVIEVWRSIVFTDTTTDYERVGFTDFSNSADEIDVQWDFIDDSATIAVIIYDLANPFSVKAGDIVGIAVRDGLRVKMRFKNLSEDEQSNSTLSFRRTVSGSTFFDLEGATRREIRFIPLLTVVQELTSSTPVVLSTSSPTRPSMVTSLQTTTPKITSSTPVVLSSSSPTTPSIVTSLQTTTPSHTGKEPPITIILGVTTSVSTCIVVILVCLLLTYIICYQGRKCTKGCESMSMDEKTNEVETKKANEAYSSITADIVAHTNEAYNIQFAGNMEMNENEAYDKTNSQAAESEEYSYVVVN